MSKPKTCNNCTWLGADHDGSAVCDAPIAQWIYTTSSNVVNPNDDAEECPSFRDDGDLNKKTKEFTNKVNYCIEKRKTVK